MFVELKKQVLAFAFGKSHLYFRFDNAALCTLESLGVDYANITEAGQDSLTALTLVGLGDYFNSVNATDKERNDIVSGIMTAIPKEKITSLLISAVILAFPLPVIGSRKANTGKPDISPLKTAFCDVMGKSESEFWGLTLREVSERWDRYAVFMGYREPVDEVLEFDDE